MRTHQPGAEGPGGGAALVGGCMREYAEATQQRATKERSAAREAKKAAREVSSRPTVMASGARDIPFFCSTFALAIKFCGHRQPSCCVVAGAAS